MGAPAPRRTPVLERALGLGGELRCTAAEFFPWAQFLHDCNPRDAWRLTLVDDSEEMRARVDGFVERLLANADFRAVSEDAVRVTRERTDDISKPVVPSVDADDSARPPASAPVTDDDAGLAAFWDRIEARLVEGGLLAPVTASTPDDAAAPRLPRVPPAAYQGFTGNVSLPHENPEAPQPMDTELNTVLIFERTPATRVPPALRVLAALDAARGDDPECMYTSQHTVLGDGNPHIFCLGQFPFGQSITSAACDYFMLHHRSGRCARDPNFLAQLSDQHRRSQSARSSTALFRSDPAALDAMTVLLESREYIENRAAIVKNPSGKEAKALLAATRRSIMMCGSKVDYHPLQRGAVLPALRGYSDFFGPQNVFFTITPDDTHSTLIGRIVLLTGTSSSSERKAALAQPFDAADFWARRPEDDVDVQVDEDGTTTLRWQRRIADEARRNPVAVAEISNRMFEQVMEHLFGMKLQSGADKKTSFAFRATERGVFGTPLAAYAINECQSRGQLHWHCQMHVSLPQWLFQHSANRPRIAAALLEAIGSQITSQAAPEAHVAELMRKAKRQPRPKFATRAPPVMPADVAAGLAAAPEGSEGRAAAVKAAADVVRAFGAEVIPTGSGAHEHRNPGTCSSGPVGHWMCRLGYCRAPSPCALAREVQIKGQSLTDLQLNAVPVQPVQYDASGVPLAFRVFTLPDGAMLAASPPDHRLVEYVFARPLIDPAVFTADPEVLYTVYVLMIERRMLALKDVRSDAAVDDYHRLQDLIEVGAVVKETLTSAELLALARLALEDDAYEFPVGVDGRPPHAALLESLDLPQKALVSFLDALHLKNLLLSETSAIVAAETAASTNAQYLCGTVSAYIVSEYMAEYMAKDKNAPHALVAFIASAFQHIHDYPSNAPDANEPEARRLARTFLQRVVNSVGGHMEVSTQQCAAAILRIPPHIGTHDITYVFHAAAVHYRATERGSGPDMAMYDGDDSDGAASDADMEAVAERRRARRQRTAPKQQRVARQEPARRRRSDGGGDGDGSSDSGADDAPPAPADDDAASRDDNADDAANDGDPAEPTRAVNRGFAGRAVPITQVDGSRSVFITSQHMEYDYRGDDLQNVSLFLWAVIVQREGKALVTPEADNAVDDAASDGEAERRGAPYVDGEAADEDASAAPRTTAKKV